MVRWCLLVSLSEKKRHREDQDGRLLKTPILDPEVKKGGGPKTGFDRGMKSSPPVGRGAVMEVSGDAHDVPACHVPLIG